MEKSFELKGHVTSGGMVVSDERVEIKPGPVEITVRTPSRQSVDDDVIAWSKKPYSKKDLEGFRKHLERIWAMPRDGNEKSMTNEEIDDAVYGDIKPAKKMRTKRKS